MGPRPWQPSEFLLPRARRSAAILFLLRPQPPRIAAYVDGADRVSAPSAALDIWSAAVALWIPQSRGAGRYRADLSRQGSALRRPDPGSLLVRANGRPRI